MKKVITMILCSLFLYMSFPMQLAIAQDQMEDVHAEHLILSKKTEKKTPINLVSVSDSEIQVESYNVLELTFAQAFNSKYAAVGDQIVFLLEKGLNTKEGTEILPPGTKVIAEISNIIKPKSFK